MQGTGPGGKNGITVLYFLLYLVFLFITGVMAIRKRGDKNPVKSYRQCRAFSERTAMISQYTLASHSIVRRQKEGRKTGRSRMGRTTDKDCSFLNHLFVCFYSQFHFLQISPWDQALGPYLCPSLTSHEILVTRGGVAESAPALLRLFAYSARNPLSLTFFWSLSDTEL